MTLTTRTRAALMALLIPSALASSCTSSHATDSGTDAAADSGTDAATDSGTDATTDSGTLDWASCTDNSQCVVISMSCCGLCGQPTVDDMVGVHRDRVADYRATRCDAVGCPACYMEPNPNLIATCDAGTCRALDVSTLALSSCSADSDCTLRAASCCACGGDSAPIAIRADAEIDFLSLVCVGDEVCPECLPAYPGWSAVCLTGGPTGGHCAGLQAMSTR